MGCIHFWKCARAKNIRNSVGCIHFWKCARAKNIRNSVGCIHFWMRAGAKNSGNAGIIAINVFVIHSFSDVNTTPDHRIFYRINTDHDSFSDLQGIIPLENSSPFFSKSIRIRRPRGRLPPLRVGRLSPPPLLGGSPRGFVESRCGALSSACPCGGQQRQPRFPLTPVGRSVSRWAL